MVQLFYYESRGKCCKKVLKYEGYPTKVLLFPYEGWARPASMAYWILKTSWWNRRRCKIVEVRGTKKYTTKGKIHDFGTGVMTVTGKFKGETDPDFRLTLTSNVSNQDFQMGYSLTGTLEKGHKKSNRWEMTHFAMIKRKGY